MLPKGVISHFIQRLVIYDLAGGFVGVTFFVLFKKSIYNVLTFPAAIQNGKLKNVLHITT